MVFGVSKKRASCHPLKPAKHMPYERRPELQKRVQTIGGETRKFLLNRPLSQLAPNFSD